VQAAETALQGTLNLTVKVVFRVDASTEIGTGHVMRCLTLADALRERGDETLFICRAHTGNQCGVIEQRGYPVHRLAATDPVKRNGLGEAQSSPAHSAWLGVDWNIDAQESLAVLARNGGRADWLIVDHYALDDRWETALRHAAERIMVIDDIADRRHDCDLLMDQNLHENAAHRYEDLVPDGCRQLLGPRYALLRPEFRAARSRLRHRHGGVRRILVFFGGIDGTDQTSKALTAIESLKRDDIAVDVVVGSQNPNRDQVGEHCRRMKNVHFHCDIDNMSALMSEADVSIGAGGGTVWERCALKLPSLAWPVAENQTEQLRMLALNGAVYLPDVASVQEPGGLAAHIDALLNNEHLRLNISRCAGEICDAKGTNRVIGNLVRPRLSVRRVCAEDCQSVYEWRNHPEIRRFSLNGQEISWERHKAWFETAINDSRIGFLIAEDDNRPIGVVRFDIADKTAEVSIYLIPGMQGKSYGRELLDASQEWLRRHRPEISDLSAKIVRANNASMRLFEEAGFENVYDVYRKRITE
jgi:UDP-2,4-diacetamido-2,4,6-trideoxy-beta-L-altropyranose hydrolase